jgi:glycosyltransferase involved in cell wall biosynthesis
MLDPTEETRKIQNIIGQSDVVILSSYDAHEDFKRVARPEDQSRAAVLQFVSQPQEATVTRTQTRGSIEHTYGFRGRFFFLPSQFWAHKNHMVVLQAVKLLKDKGINVLVLCTGSLQDLRYRDTKYVDRLYQFIELNSLEDRVKILGRIDYDDVLSMMEMSLAVLNPSRFEGWSSSVEEEKSMGKPTILSRIGVHFEQNPPNARYFDPDDAAGLAQIMEDLWAVGSDGSDDDAKRLAREALRERTVEYGRAYLSLVSALVGRESEPA